MSSRLRAWSVLSVGALLTFLVMLVAGAGAAPTTGLTDQSRSARQADSVKITLGFVWQPQFLPLLWGVNKGYFREQGIDLTIIPTSGPTQSIQLLEAGQADFALPTFQEYALARTLNQTSSKVVYSYMPQPNLGIVSRVQLRTPADLVGKTYGTTAASSSDLVLKGLMKDAGLDPNSLTVKKLDFAVLYPSLFQGTVDIAEGSTPGSWRNLQRTAERTGITLYQVPMTDWGLKGLGRTLIAPDSTIARKPGLVKRMVTAIHKSLVDSRAKMSGDDAAALLATQITVADPVAAARDWADFVALTGGAGPVDPSGVAATLKFLSGGGFISNPRPLTDYYTNLFAPASVKGNQPPKMTFLSLRRTGSHLAARFRVCDDARGTLVVILRQAKSKVAPSTERFNVRLSGKCGTYSKQWAIARKFTARPGQLKVTLGVRDAARRAGNDVSRTIKVGG